MYATYHLSSAEELNTELLKAIKATFKTKAIKIIVEEDDALSDDMKADIDNRLNEPTTEYITAKDSIDILNNKYGV